MTETIAALAGGGLGVGILIWLFIRTVPWFLVAVATAVTAFQKDPTVHRRLRGVLRDLQKSNDESLTGGGETN
jgi:hypothetical protein